MYYCFLWANIRKYTARLKRKPQRFPSAWQLAFPSNFWFTVVIVLRASASLSFQLLIYDVVVVRTNTGIISMATLEKLLRHRVERTWALRCFGGLRFCSGLCHTIFSDTQLPTCPTWFLRRRWHLATRWGGPLRLCSQGPSAAHVPSRCLSTAHTQTHINTCSTHTKSLPEHSTHTNPH